MKKRIFWTSIAFGLLSILPMIAFAQLSKTSRKPFGAQVLSTTIPSVLCAAQYGTLLRPVTKSPSMPYFIRATQKKVQPGSWILGWYNPTTDTSTCQTTTTPPTPVPALQVIY